MELVYLWVEEYKNIKNQGFNFSPRFTCKYDEFTKELTIEESKSYVSIFPPKINVMAIVGENGAGKSGLLELLMLLFYGSPKHDENMKNNWLVTYSIEENCFKLSYFQYAITTFKKICIDRKELFDESIEINQNFYYFKRIEKVQEYSNIFYNNSVEYVSSHFLDNIPEIMQKFSGSIDELDFKPSNLNIFSFPSKKNYKIDIRKNENIAILNMFKIKDLIDENDIKLILNHLNNQNLNFIPLEVYLDTDDQDLKQKMLNGEIKKILEEETSLDLTLKGIHRYFILFVLSTVHIPFNKQEKIQEYYLKDCNIKRWLIEKLDTFVNKDEYNVINRVASYLYNNIDELMQLTKDVHLSDLIENSSKSLNSEVYDLAKLIDYINKINNDNILTEKISDMKHIKNILPNIPYFIKIQVSNGNILYNDFSFGEKSIMNLIYSLLYYISFQRNKKINIFVDEIEIGLNPNWQKKVLNTLLKLLENIKKLKDFRDKKFNLILTSHSPFLLSDLPKENVIFLENGKQVYPDIQTFGANIHTLLSHGFFMKDGLMGEFAKNKINEVIDYLNGKDSPIEHDDKAQRYIRIIGEPILKRQLQKMLDSKRLSEVETIKKQIADLQEKLEKHQHAQN